MEVIKLAIIFVLVMVALGLNRPMYLVMAGAAVLAGLFYAMPPGEWLRACAASLTSSATVTLVLIVWLVMLLEGVMNNNGYLSRLTTAMDALFHSRRLNILSMPVIIGFLPSAGGALLSAPLVAQAAEGCELSPETLSNVNNYYRHIMELCFPTYSALLVLSQISGVSLAVLVTRLFPLALLALLLGLLLLGRLPAQPRAQRAGSPPFYKRLWRLLAAMWPFALLLLLIMAVKLSVPLSCGLTLAAVLLATRTGPRQWPQLIRAKTKWRLLLITVSIMLFKDVLEASGALAALPPLVSRLPLPPLIIYSLMCLFISMITGVVISSTGVVIPLLLATVPEATPAMLCFLHVSGYIGAQITPTHSCVVLSADYFHASLPKAILRSLPLYALIYLAALGTYLLLWP